MSGFRAEEFVERLDEIRKELRDMAWAAQWFDNDVSDLVMAGAGRLGDACDLIEAHDA